MHVLNQHLNKLGRARDHKLEGLLIAIVSAGLWPNARVNQVKPFHPPIVTLAGPFALTRRTWHGDARKLTRIKMTKSRGPNT